MQIVVVITAIVCCNSQAAQRRSSLSVFQSSVAPFHHRLRDLIHSQTRTATQRHRDQIIHIAAQQRSSRILDARSQGLSRKLPKSPQPNQDHHLCLQTLSRRRQNKDLAHIRRKHPPIDHLGQHPIQPFVQRPCGSPWSNILEEPEHNRSPPRFADVPQHQPQIESCLNLASQHDRLLAMKHRFDRVDRIDRCLLFRSYRKQRLQSKLQFGIRQCQSFPAIHGCPVKQLHATRCRGRHSQSGSSSTFRPIA